MVTRESSLSIVHLGSYHAALGVSCYFAPNKTIISLIVARFFWWLSRHVSAFMLPSKKKKTTENRVPQWISTRCLSDVTIAHMHQAGKSHVYVFLPARSYFLVTIPSMHVLANSTKKHGWFSTGGNFNLYDKLQKVLEILCNEHFKPSIKKLYQ